MENLELKISITEMKKLLKLFNSRYGWAEKIQQTRQQVEIMLCEQQKEKRMNKNDQSLRDLQVTFECTNVHTIGIPEGEGGSRNNSEGIMTENFPNLIKALIYNI